MSRQAMTAAVVAAVVIVIGLLVFYLYPSTTVPPGTEGSGVTEAERGDTARDIIADLRESDSVDYGEAYTRAKDFQGEGRLADAQLLYFFAARGGNAQSAFELGTMSDPNHHSPETSLLPQPDPFQAYKWYTQALEGGVTAARQRLDALHEWADKQSQAGDVEAERLLLQWE